MRFRIAVCFYGIGYERTVEAFSRASDETEDNTVSTRLQID